MNEHIRTIPLTLLALLLLAGTAVPASAQLPPDLRDTRYTGLGYSASIPSILTGVAAFHHMPSIGVGVFANARFSLDSPSSESRFREDMTTTEAFQLGDVPVGTRDSHAMWSVGAFRALNADLAVFLGVGHAEEKSYREFFDESRERGEFGHYWVEAHGAARSGLNYSGGVLIRATRNFFFQGGFETLPKGITVAGFLALPW